jgi:hypothetical protein
MDEKLLAAARQAQEQLVEADHAAEVAKAQFHRAVRRLHLSGASLRELAAALNLSHQRVHQIVETAGGARRWGRRGRLPPEPGMSGNGTFPCKRFAPETWLRTFKTWLCEKPLLSTSRPEYATRYAWMT